MTKKREPNIVVMLNLVQHLVYIFLPLACIPFIPILRTGFLGAISVRSSKGDKLFYPLPLPTDRQVPPPQERKVREKIRRLIRELSYSPLSLR